MHCLRQVSDIYTPELKCRYSLAHADAQYGYLASEVLYGVSADARIRLWMPRTGTNDQLGRVKGYQFLDGDCIVAVYSDGGSFQDEILIYVPREGIKVVNQYNVRGTGQRWNSLRLLRGVVNEIEGHVGCVVRSFEVTSHRVPRGMGTMIVELPGWSRSVTPKARPG